MKLANLAGRMVLLGTDGCADIEGASGGKLPSAPGEVIERWDEVVDTLAGIDIQNWEAFDETRLDAPLPSPRQSMGIGLNYRAHAIEAGWDIPSMPLLFSKLPGCLTGPFDDIEVPSETTDWEVELVVVIGRHADRVSEADALSVVAGYSVGQDISERTVQRSKPGPQFTLGKSYRTFGPWGPSITTLDELVDPGNLEISCELNGEVMQNSRTSDLIFDVSELISFLSARFPLYPGDLIFTGTPAGIGSARKPSRFLTPGDVLTSRIDGVGTMTNHCVAAAIE